MSENNDKIFQNPLMNPPPDFPYYKYINTPSQIGMSDKGTLKQLGNNIDGLKSYIELLVSGKGDASATGQPLGNKFFLKTGGKCSVVPKDLPTDSTTDSTATDATTTTEEQDRYIYINNVPQGNIPFISSGMGVNFSEFRGLIPGTISNLNAFNPSEIFQAFLSGSKPECQELTMETIDIYNNKSTETHYVTLVDIKNMDPCSFQNKTNPITGAKCKESFSNLGTQSWLSDYGLMPKIPKDPIAQLYFASLGLLTIYILYRIMLKTKRIY